jgi:invasion protein IalB
MGETVRVSRAAAFVAWAIIVAHAPAYAADAASPSVQSGSPERIGDWEVVCTPGAKKPAEAKPACRLVQNHSGEGGGSVLLVTIVLQDVAKVPVAVVSVPEGVYLAPGIELKVDDGQSFKLLYETCNSSGCHAGYKVEGEIGKALRKGTIAQHKLFDSKQKPVTIPVSLKGFAKGLDRLHEVAR